MPSERQTDVLIVGGGPTGLTAARELGKQSNFSVTLIDRESQAGGIPRHCDHQGFGWFDLRQLRSGPSYAEKLVQRASSFPNVEIRENTTAIEWGDGSILTTSPLGLVRYHAKAILLATGCRERPRSARLISGNRTNSVYTTGALQQLVHFKKKAPGKRALVVGAEHVSYSAIHTLESIGTRVVGIVSQFPRTQTYQLVHRFFTRRIPFYSNTEVVSIHGHKQVETVRLRNVKTKTESLIDCDCVVFTGDWIPDHELARTANITLDTHTRGPQVDFDGRTNQIGIFAAGNLCHPAEMADKAALNGKQVARSILKYLRHPTWPDKTLPSFELDPSIKWVHPNKLRSDHWAGARYAFRVRNFQEHASLQIRQGQSILAEKKFRRLIPERAYYLPTGFEHKVRTNEHLYWKLNEKTFY